MTIASYIILSVILYILGITFQDIMATKQYGLGPLVGPRDTLAEPSNIVGRAKRMNQNMLEALAMFAPLALLAIHTDTAGATLGAAVFFWARVAYAPLYILGVPWLRTLAWLAGVAGIIMMILKLLPLI